MAINGGIKSLDEARAQLEHMDGVMVGREAYQNPGILARSTVKFSASPARMPIR